MGKLLTVLFLVLLLFGCNSAADKVDTDESAPANEVTTGDIYKKSTEVKPAESIPEITVEQDTLEPSVVISMKDMGEMKTILEKDPDELEFRDDRFKIEVDKYVLSEMKIKEEYKSYFEETFENTDKIALLGIWLDFENLTNEDINLQAIQGIIEIDSGESQNIIVEFEEEGHENFINEADDDLDDGTIMASFSTAPELIKEVTIRLEGFVEIKFEL